MKLHYTKILLFFFPLKILLTSYNAHNKNKPSITPHHTRTTTSRLLSEYDTESSIYDSDEEINSVKEIFERQTSRRFEEYEERMITQRQKYKEQRDKDIQQIIHKDKMQKNLAEKIEKGCLRCGCGLAGVAGSIGVFGGVAINIWKPAALEAAIEKALELNAAYISAAANAAGAAEITKLIKSTFLVKNIAEQPFESFFTATPYKNVASIAKAVYEQHFNTCAYDSSGNLVYLYGDGNLHIPICRSVWQQISAVLTTKKGISTKEVIEQTVQNIATRANGPANAAAEIARENAINAIKAREADVINTIFMSKQTAIIASVVAILVIVSVMIIIYLILRYRRKKKMKKKAQYTKLLNE
ncbi:PIR protein, putative [Plasmodium sp.]|nr:PIR protein, putative [Plasmodium sp.]